MQLITRVCQTHTQNTLRFHSIQWLGNAMNNLLAYLFQGTVKFQQICIVLTAKIRLGHAVVTSTKVKRMTAYD